MLSDPVSRDRLLISACILSVIALAWAYLLHLAAGMSASMAHDRMMAEMGMTMDMRWTRTDVFFAFVMWTVMMVGMMSGSALPVLLLFAAARARRAGHASTFSIAAFGLGYIVVWTGFSAVAALVQWTLHEKALLSPAMAAASAQIAGAILVIAGGYQFTPLKGACLAHCRSPLGFLMGHWRDGIGGAFRMGVRHGAYCLGCCWAMMCVLFAVGVMNLVWVAALTVFVLAEKIAPRGAMISRAAGAAMIVYGLVVAL